MKLKLIMLVSLFAFGFAMSATAGSVTDSDSDLVPDEFDNCVDIANGPNDTSNQVDTDLDGYGNRCDFDYDQDGQTLVADFGLFLGVFPGPVVGGDIVFDADGDEQALVSDFGLFLGFFPGDPPGPSGVACAAADGSTSPCTP